MPPFQTTAAGSPIRTTAAGSRWSTVQPWLGVAARLGLAAVWLVAGGTKLDDLAASGRAVNAYQLLPYDLAVVVGTALPFVEITLGVLLLVGLATRLAAGVATGLLLVFIAGISSAWARGLAIDCGCFSSGGELAAGRVRATARRSCGILVSWRWPGSC